MDELRYILINRREGMLERCQNPNHTQFKYYGGRGITVCQEWKQSPQAFVDWALTNGFKPDLQLDRIDNDKGYSPDNCRWVTARDNIRNRSTTKITVEIAGQAKFLKSLGLFTLMELAHYFNVNVSTLANVFSNDDKWSDVEPTPISIPVSLMMAYIKRRDEVLLAKKLSEGNPEYDLLFNQWETRAGNIRYEREILGKSPSDIKDKYKITDNTYYAIMNRKKFPTIEPIKPTE